MSSFVKNVLAPTKKSHYSTFVSKRIKQMYGRSFAKKGVCQKKFGKKSNKKPISDEKVLAHDIYDLTGIFEEMFLDLFDKVKEKMNQGYDLRRKMKRHKLSRMMRLLLVLTWLRKYPNLVDLKDKFDVSESTSKREVDFLLSILVENLNIIKWPEVPEKDWESCVGSVDGTPHYKNRTHPKQADYYRGDKHAFFINSQVEAQNLAAKNSG